MRKTVSLVTSVKTFHLLIIIVINRCPDLFQVGEDWLVSYSVGRLVGQSVGRLVGQSVGRLDHCKIWVFILLHGKEVSHKNIKIRLTKRLTSIG